MALFRKPETICQITTSLEHLRPPYTEFIEAETRAIEERLAVLSLRLRLATRADLHAIEQFQRQHSPGMLVEDLSVLYRIIAFGYVSLIETSAGTLAACQLTEGYDDLARTHFGVRITVDSAMGGHNLGAALASYSCLLGLVRGARLRRALVNLANVRSATNHFNHVGYVAETFDPPQEGSSPWARPRFHLVLPLTPGGVKNNGIDQDKLRVFRDSTKNGLDYLVVDAKDVDGVTTMYRETPFRVVAVVQEPAGPAYLALPREMLGF